MTETKRKTKAAERWNRMYGTDELNICEFPLASCGRRAPHGTLVFEDEVFDEGNRQLVRRRLVISASDAFGLPTPADSDVLLVLMYLTNVRNRLAKRTVDFTRYELAKLLGWDRSGKFYRRLEESLNRWASVTLAFRHAWWDRDDSRWRSLTFHVLDSVDLRGKGANRDDGMSTFTWNEVIFGSFQSKHIKRLNLDTYFQLKSPAARQAYRFLDKRFYWQSRLEFDLRVFACEHVGLSRSYDNTQLRRKLQPAIDELERVGFVTPASTKERYCRRKRGEWVIAVERAKARQEPAAFSERAPSAMVSQLTKRGIHAAAAKRLVRNFPEQSIAKKIAFFDSEQNSGRPKRPGWLRKAIEEDYRLPDAVSEPTPLATPQRMTTGHATRREEVKRKREAREEQVRAERSSLLQQRLERLSPQERENIEQKAASCAPDFLRSRYENSKSMGPTKTFEEYRRLILERHLLGSI